MEIFILDDISFHFFKKILLARNNIFIVRKITFVERVRFSGLYYVMLFLLLLVSKENIVKLNNKHFYTLLKIIFYWYFDSIDF